MKNGSINFNSHLYSQRVSFHINFDKRCCGMICCKAIKRRALSFKRVFPVVKMLKYLWFFSGGDGDSFAVVVHQFLRLV